MSYLCRSLGTLTVAVLTVLTLGLPAVAAAQVNAVKDGWLVMKVHSEFVDEDVLSGSNIDVDVNHGVVTSRTDMLHLLRPLLKQTVTYRYLRGRDVVAHGTGWMERIVFDTEETSTYFAPLAITLNIDSFEHLEFETRPDQLLVYTLVQGDERVIVEFAPIGPGDVDASPFAPRQLEFDTSGFVQMELQGLDVRADDDRA